MRNTLSTRRTLPLLVGFGALGSLLLALAGAVFGDSVAESRPGGTSLHASHMSPGLKHDSPAHRRRQFDETLHRVDQALRAMGGGNPNPYIALWERSPDVTLYGAWGPIERGYDALRRTFEWVGSRFSDGELVPENLVIDVSGELAYTVGFERGEVSVDGGPRVPMTIRVTHTYRYSGGEWRLIHRHADFPPKDQRGGERS
jgi:ketosteroid isomerase-like protein